MLGLKFPCTMEFVKDYRARLVPNSGNAIEWKKSKGDKIKVLTLILDDKDKPKYYQVDTELGIYHEISVNTLK